MYLYNKLYLIFVNFLQLTGNNRLKSILSMGTGEVTVVPNSSNSNRQDAKQGMVLTITHEPKKKRICCACPETKKLRDECIVEHGEESCKKWIDAHRQCLRAEGFKV